MRFPLKRKRKSNVGGVVSKLRETTNEIRWRRELDGVMSSMYKEAREAENNPEVEKRADPERILQIQLDSLRRRRDMLDESLGLYSKHGKRLKGRVPEDVYTEEEMRAIRAPIDLLEKKTLELMGKLKR